MNESCYLKNHLLNDFNDKYKQDDDKIFIFNNKLPSEQNIILPSEQKNQIADDFYNNILNNILIHKNNLLNNKKLLISYKFDNDLINNINKTHINILNGSINFVKSNILNNNCLLINNNTELKLSDLDLSNFDTLSIIFWININN